MDDEIMIGVDALENASQADATVIVTDHAATDYAPIVAEAALIVDTRNALRRFTSANIIRL
jgi:UDP-N-acetyl-D-mannosaminuronate dehydrogenase